MASPKVTPVKMASPKVTPVKKYKRDYSKLCRFCGEFLSGKDVINIYTSKDKKLLNLLHDVQLVSENDDPGLPNHFCKKCQRCVSSFKEFKYKSLLLKERLLSQLQATKRLQKSPSCHESSDVVGWVPDASLLHQVKKGLFIAPAPPQDTFRLPLTAPTRRSVLTPTIQKTFHPQSGSVPDASLLHQVKRGLFIPPAPPQDTFRLPLTAPTRRSVLTPTIQKTFRSPQSILPKPKQASYNQPESEIVIQLLQPPTSKQIGTSQYIPLPKPGTKLVLSIPSIKSAKTLPRPSSSSSHVAPPEAEVPEPELSIQVPVREKTQSVTENTKPKTTKIPVPVQSIRYTRVLKHAGIDGLRYEASDKPLTSNHKLKLLAAASKQNAELVADVAYAIPPIRRAIKRKVLQELKSDSNSLTRRTDNQLILGRKDYNSMETFSWDNIINEMNERFPMLLDILLTVMDKGGKFPDSKMPVIAAVYGVIMNQRDNYLSLVPRMMTLLMINGGAKKEAFRQLNHVGFCQSHQQKARLLDTIGDHSLDAIKQRVEKGAKYQICGDNIDYRIRAHDMTVDAKNVDVHNFSTSIWMDRVTSEESEQERKPQIAMEDIKPDIFLLKSAEEYLLRSYYIKYIARVLCEDFERFKFLEKTAHSVIEHRHSKEMSQQTYYRFCEILYLNEQDYGDTVKILDEYEKWVAELYGVDVQDVEQGPPIRGSSSRPGQPAAHQQATPEPDDPLKGVQVPVSGDQLTRVRFAGACDLRCGCDDPRHRFDHLYPFICNPWHAKKAFLNLIFDEMMGKKKAAVADRGTLTNLRELLDQRNVSTPDKNYEGCETFFLVVGRAYLTMALRDFFGLSSNADSPTKNDPQDEDTISPEAIEAYMMRTLGTFVDSYVLIDPEKERLEQMAANSSQDIRVNAIISEHGYAGRREQPEETELKPDYQRNYATSILDFYLMMLQLIDTTKEGDGDRLLLNMKRLLLYFKTAGSSKSNYAIEMFVAIAQAEALLSKGQAEQILFQRFVNLRGGSGHNIENDLGHEILNGFAKRLISDMGANKTEKAVKRASKASGGLKDIVDNFNSTTKLHRLSSKHSHRSQEKGLKRIVTLFEPKQQTPGTGVFDRVPGRRHKSFPNVNTNYLQGLDMTKLKTWLEGKISEIEIGLNF